MPEPECQKCQVRLQEGFLLELGDGNVARPQQWIEGAPEKSWFGMIKLRGKKRLAVATYRCPRCGVLTSIAREA